MSYFVYNGRSSEEFGLRIESKNIFSAPEFDAEFTSIPGRSGDLIVSNNCFKNVEVTYTVFLARKTVEELADVLTEIKGWLYTDPDRYHEISDSYDKKHIRYGVISGSLDIGEQLNKVGLFTVTFNCKPFRYSNAGLTNIEILDNGYQVTNPYPFPAKPYFRLDGNGDVTLTIQSGRNIATWQIKDLEQYIECDSELMNFYKETELQNLKVSGDGFPVLHPGVNTLTFTGNVKSISLVPRWCCL